MKNRDLISALSAYDPYEDVGVEIVESLGAYSDEIDALSVSSVAHTTNGTGPRIVLSTDSYLQVRRKPLSKP